MIEWKEAPPAMTDIAKEIILRHHPELRDARIGFILRSEPGASGGRPVYSKTAKVDSKMQAFLENTGDGLDFIVWISADYWNNLSSERRQALIDHELCHCTVGPSGFALCGHDVEEFIEIIQRYGAWTADLMKAEQAFEGATLAHAVRQARMFEDAGAVISIKPSQMAEVTMKPVQSPDYWQRAAKDARMAAERATEIGRLSHQLDAANAKINQITDIVAIGLRHPDQAIEYLDRIRQALGMTRYARIEESGDANESNTGEMPAWY